MLKLVLVQFVYGSNRAGQLRCFVISFLPEVGFHLLLIIFVSGNRFKWLLWLFLLLLKL